MCPGRRDVRCGALAPYKRLGEKAEKCTKENGEKMLGVTWRDRKRESWIRGQTKVDDVMATTKKKKWAWSGHVIRRTDNRRTVRVTEWLPSNCRSQGGQRTRWREG